MNKLLTVLFGILPGLTVMLIGKKIMSNLVLKFCGIVTIFGFISILFVPGLAVFGQAQVEEYLATQLYRAGKVEEARTEYEQQLVEGELSSNPEQLWQALMAIAWFHGEIGEYHQAIEHTNRSLEIAHSLKNPFFIGRSLCWLGMNYANMGLYELALDFYFKALELGAPGGEIKIVAVWGLAQQEIGAISFRMGDIAKARFYLEKTFAFAKSHQIPPGISEGGAHLAEIAITEGELPKAVSLAEAAVATAEKCGCSPQNLARARVMLAKAEVQRAQLQPELRQNAESLIKKSIETAEKTGNIRWQAEGYLLLSQFLPQEQIEERLTLIDNALTLLVNSESEIRGTAEAQLGRLYLENEQPKLAEFYLKQGYSINQELFRRVDNAYILADISDLLSFEGKHKQAWEKIFESTQEALAISNLPLALENQELMAAELETEGFYRLAYQWTESALETLQKLNQKQISEASTLDLQQRKLPLRERQVRLAVHLVQDKSQ